MEYKVPPLKQLSAQKYLADKRAGKKPISQLPAELIGYVNGNFIDGRTYNLHDPRCKNFLSRILFEPGTKFRAVEFPVSLQREVETISSISVNEQGLLAAGTDKDTLYIWDLLNQKALIFNENLRATIKCLKFCSKSDDLFIGGTESSFIYSRTEEGKYVKRKELKYGGEIIAFNTDENLVALSIAKSQILRIYSKIKDISAEFIVRSRITSLKFIPDKKILLVFYSDAMNIIKFDNWDINHLVKVLLSKDGLFNFITFSWCHYKKMSALLEISPCYNFFVLEQNEETAKFKLNVVDIENRKFIKTIYESPKSFCKLEFNQDGSLLAAIDYDGNIAIFDMTRNHGTLLIQIKAQEYCSGYSKCVNGSSPSVAFLPIEPYDRYLVVAIDEYIFILDLWKFY